MKIVKKIFSKIRTPNFFRRFRRPRTRREKIFSATAVAIVALVVILGWHRFGAFAQSVIDTFADSTKISATWQTTVDTGSHQVTLAQKACNASVWYCAQSTVCADTLGDGTNIIVAQADAPSTYTWKNANTNCSQPQCQGSGGQNGNQMVPDETVNFSNYSAQNYCKSIGGRLPTKDELNCIYTNRATFGTFASSFYWSGTEASTAGAWDQSFSAGNQGGGNKTVSNYVRCVRGW